MLPFHRIILGKTIKELRTEKGYTQQELAKQIGVTQGAIYFWKKEINEPTAGYLLKLAKTFNVTLDELLSNECAVLEAGATRAAEMTALFNKLTDTQQDILISTAKEMLKP